MRTVPRSPKTNALSIRFDGPTYETLQAAADHDQVAIAAVVRKLVLEGIRNQTVAR